MGARCANTISIKLLLMDNFIVSARKYRPSTFQSVVGQASITTTLKNAIQRNQLAQAYLFCGPRGVGKTTCARIFAKTINCQNLTDDFEACNECESCTSFNTSRSYNIHELDAASNNSVEGIRKLIEQVRIPPQIGKYSVYIIDEVHMLSQSAFNAFLKTLEEPPAHAIFIMATTEKHKILPTILSRCQIFDFNRIKVEDTVKYLEYIAQQEGVGYEIDALNIIAQKADGAMRDALSIFDQVVSFSDNQITYAKTIENLNVLDYQYYFKLTENFLGGNVADSLNTLDTLLSKGFDAQQFITGLSLHIRNILVSKDPQTIQLLEVGAAIAERYKQMAAKCPPDFLVNALNLTNQFDVNFRQSPNQRLHVELLLIRLCGLNQEKKKSDNPSVSANTGIEIKAQTPPPFPSPAHQLGAQVKPYAVGEPEPSSSTTQRSTIPSKKITKTISLKNIVNGNTPIINGQDEGKKDKVGQPTTSGRANNFTQEELVAVWNAYAKNVEHEKPTISTIMQKTSPYKTSNSEILITLDNQVQEELINESKQGLTNYLKQELQNTSIYITTKIELSENSGNTGTRLYTREDKLKYMIEQNPALVSLIKKLDLDLE